MKKFLFSLLTIFTFVAFANAQVTTVTPPVKSDVKAQSYDYRATATGYAAQWVGDGRNVRAGFNIGGGMPVGQVYGNLPKTLADFRLVPFVTVDGSQSGAAPRATVALLAPELYVNRYLGVQLGGVLNGLDTRNDWKAVSGVLTYVKVAVYLTRK